MGDVTPAEVVRRYVEAIGRQDLDAALACWSPGSIGRLVPVGELRVPDEHRAYFEEVFAAMPDFTNEVLDIFAQGDLVALQWRASGVFTGRPFRGIRANGARIQTEGVDLARVENGLIVRLDSYWDDAAIARQIGVLPATKSIRERALLGLFNTKTRLTSAVGRRRRSS